MKYLFLAFITANTRTYYALYCNLFSLDTDYLNKIPKGIYSSKNTFFSLFQIFSHLAFVKKNKYMDLYCELHLLCDSQFTGWLIRAATRQNLSSG